MSTFHRDTPEFGSNKPGLTGDPTQCAACEAMLADALDGTLSAEDKQRFESHMTSCTACAEMLADAQRGAAWLELLRDPRPEPPALLVERILQRTQAESSRSIALVQPLSVAGLPYAPAQAAAPSNLYAFPNLKPGQSMLRSLHRTLLQPRLAMTAAMAFFSIGLTLNLTGVQLNQIHASGLKPSTLRRNFYQANASVIRYYDNLRVVYELESRVRELQRTGDAEPAKQPEADQPEKRPAPHSGAGSSRQQIRPTDATPESLAISNDRSTTMKKGELA